MSISVKIRLGVLYTLAISITISNFFSYGFLEFMDYQPRPYVIMWILFGTGGLSFILEIFSAIFCRPSKIQNISKLRKTGIDKRVLGMLNIMYMLVIFGLILWVLPLSLGLSIVTESWLKNLVTQTIVWTSILTGIASIFVIVFCRPTKIIKLIGQNHGNL